MPRQAAPRSEVQIASPPSGGSGAIRRVLEAPLESAAREARHRAVVRLLELRRPDGRWRQDFDLPVLYNSAYVVFLHRLGLNGTPWAVREQAGLARHLVAQAEEGWGFPRFPGGEPSAAMTRLALVALRLVRDDLKARRPGRHAASDGEHDGDTLVRVEAAIDGAQGYLPGAADGWSLQNTFDSLLFEKLLLAGGHDTVRVMPGLGLFEPELVAWVQRSTGMRAAQQHASVLARAAVPAVSILYREACTRGAWSRWHLSAARRVGYLRRLEARSIAELADIILQRQNPDGGWFYSSYLTMINLLALRSAAVSTRHPAVRLAIAWLRDRLYPTDNGGLALSPFKADVWDTSLAVLSYLADSSHRSDDPEITAAVDLLLGEQRDDGGLAWGTGATNDPDSDSTALAVRAFARAAASAHGDRLGALDGAIRRGVAYLMRRQDVRGGYGVWEPTAARPRPGPVGVARQLVLDVASADTTARVLRALAESGMTTEDHAVRRALRFLVRMQSDNGAWWCRWWAGYAAGTCFVLEAMAALAVRVGVQETSDDPLLRRVRRSMARGVRFLLDHQGCDGGWGESAAADRDVRDAARGRSRVLQTAFAVTALLGCGVAPHSRAVTDAVRYLLESADSDGRWRDGQTTFTIFARWWYYSYPLYSAILPLDALTAYLDAVGTGTNRAVGAHPAGL